MAGGNDALLRGSRLPRPQTQNQSQDTQESSQIIRANTQNQDSQATIEGYKETNHQTTTVPIHQGSMLSIDTSHLAEGDTSGFTERETVREVHDMDDTQFTRDDESDPDGPPILDNTDPPIPGHYVTSSQMGDVYNVTDYSVMETAEEEDRLIDIHDCDHYQKLVRNNPEKQYRVLRGYEAKRRELQHALDRSMTQKHQQYNNFQQQLLEKDDVIKDLQFRLNSTDADLRSELDDEVTRFATLKKDYLHDTSQFNHEVNRLKDAVARLEKEIATKDAAMKDLVNTVEQSTTFSSVHICELEDKLAKEQAVSRRLHEELELLQLPRPHVDTADNNTLYRDPSPIPEDPVLVNAARVIATTQAWMATVKDATDSPKKHPGTDATPTPGQGPPNPAP